MKLPTCSLAILAGISLVTPAFAVINVDYVTVGNAGNAADTTFDPTGYGVVDYVYNIGKYEVTKSQYISFLNAADPSGANANGIYNPSMGSNAWGGISFNAGAASGEKYTIRTSMGDKPVNYVSWYDSARFTNWLNNGQGAGSTETGAYDLSLVTPGKSVGATVWLPSENEWYKAAYYNPTPGASGNNYWLYPTQSDTVPTVGTANAIGDITNPGANVASYLWDAIWNSQNGNVTTVGSAAANNYFGTTDQGGNVREWNDAVISDSSRGQRGGSFQFLGIQSSIRPSNVPSVEGASVGFRVASVPEPSGLVLAMLASGLMLARRKR